MERGLGEFGIGHDERRSLRRGDLRDGRGESLGRFGNGGALNGGRGESKRRGERRGRRRGKRGERRGGKKWREWGRLGEKEGEG